MPKINGTITDDGTQITTTYTGNVTDKERSYYFDDTQDGMILTNNGTDTLSLNVEGEYYSVQSGSSVSVTKEFYFFSIKRNATGSNNFTLSSYVYKKTIAGIEDTLISTNKNNALSANQGKVLKGLVDINTANIATNTANISANTASLAERALHVTSYGAKGNGISDDTSSIQNAITDAINKKLPLYFPNGTYKVNTNIKFANATGIKIYGGNGAILSVSSSFVGDLITFENCQDVSVRGLKFDGGGLGGVNTNPGNVGLSFTKQSKNITVNGCTFRGFTDVAIRAITETPPPDSTGLGVSDVTRTNLVISNNIFLENEHCLITKYGGARNLTISNNIVHKGSAGFKIDGESFSSYSPSTWTDFPTLSGNAVISNNVFSELDTIDYSQNFGTGAIVLEENVENVIVSNNIMSDFKNTFGVMISGGQGDRIFRNISILNNKMTNFNTGGGIGITGGVGRDVEDVAIEGNTFKNFNATVMRIESKQAIKNLSIKNNRMKDICQNTAYLGAFTPTTVGIYIINSTYNTYYAKDVIFADNDFMYTSSSTFDEQKHYLVIEGFKVLKHEDLRVERNSLNRPTTTTVGTTGHSFQTVDKVLVQNNFFESGRSFTKHSDILYRRNKFYGHRLSLGSGATIATPVAVEECEFVSDGNGLNEYLKAENNTQLSFKDNTIGSGLFLTTLTGTTFTDRSRTIIKNAAPTQNAAFIGQIYINNTTAGSEIAHVAVRTGTGATDWKQIS